MGESSIRHIGSVYRHQSLGAAQSRFRHPGRSRTRYTARTCACSVRLHPRLLALALALASVLPVTPHVPLPSSRCVRPVLSLLIVSCLVSRLFGSICIPYIPRYTFQFSRHIVQKSYPRCFQGFWPFMTCGHLPVGLAL